MKTFAIFGLIVCAASSQAVLLDDFTTGSYTTNFQDALGSYRGLVASSSIGGDRFVRLDITANPLEGSARARVQNSFGVFQVSSEADVDTFVQLGYGYSSTTSAPGDDPLNLNLVSEPLVKINFRSNDVSLPTTVKLVTNGGANSYTRSLNVSGGILPSSPQTITFDFTSDAALLGDVDGIEISFDTAPDGDFALTTVSAVPEPASIAALTVGVAAILRRKRK